jgi:hypothetical protein
MISIWSSRNIEHLQKHDVLPEEAQDVVANAQPPYPEDVGHEKWSVRDKTVDGRFLQVIFVYVSLDDIEPDEWARLRPDQRMALEDGEEAYRVIHARDLTNSEKRRLRRRRRR